MRLSSIIFNCPFEYDVKRSFGFMRSLFILYVHVQDHLGFGMLTVETTVIAFVDFNSSNCDRKGQSYPVEYYLESVEEYSEGKTHMSEPESGNGILCTLLIRPGEILESVARSLFTTNEHVITNVSLDHRRPRRCL